MENWHTESHLQIVTRVLLNKHTYTDSVSQTPYFAGIITGSLIWVVYCWVTRLLPGKWQFRSWDAHPKPTRSETQYHSLAQLMFAVSAGLCAYNFFRAVTLDPGTCPKPSSDEELKSVSRL